MSIGKHLRFVTLIIAVLAFCVHADVQQLLPVQTHWIANSGLDSSTNTRSDVSDMSIYYSTDTSESSGNPYLLLGFQRGGGGKYYSKYSRTNGFSSASSIASNSYHSDTTSSRGIKCQINNLWGRAFYGRLSASPTGESAPSVTCSNGASIRGIEDPTALAFDNSGKLLVADNGPAQNIKIFNISNPTSPALVRTFGDSGGVFSQSLSNATYIPGSTGPRRFCGIRGLAVDSLGNVYVATSGFYGHTSGTDIRAFSHTDSSLLWQVQGLASVNTADFNPASNGLVVATSSSRFIMDYTKAPGSSWKQFSVTLDPFKYPNDPRLLESMSSVFEKVVDGTRYQYYINDYANFIYVTRFIAGSEIGIPTAWISLSDYVGWASDKAPTWQHTNSNKNKRWYWVDRNGDGNYQDLEFGTYENWNTDAQGIDIDEVGDIWISGSSVINKRQHIGGITRIRAGSFFSSGTPAYQPDAATHYTSAIANESYVSRIVHLAHGDILFEASGNSATQLSSIYRYDNYTDSSKRVQTCRIELGLNDTSPLPASTCDTTTVPWTLPWSFTADSDYVYVTYFYRGRYSRTDGEVSVYDARTCQPVGFVTPDTSIHNVGFSTITNSIHVASQLDGHKLIAVANDKSNAVMVYRWMPTTRPDSISGFIATADTVSVKLKWSASKSATSYNIYMSIAATVEMFIGSTSDTTYMMRPLTGGEIYTFRVAGMNAAGVGVKSQFSAAVPITAVVVPVIPVVQLIPGSQLPRTVAATSFTKYLDLTPGNSGSALCDTTDVDAEVSQDTSNGGCNVGWTQAGEWLEYDVSSEKTATYNVTARLASAGAAGSVMLALDSVSFGSATTELNGWQEWSDINVGQVVVPAGNHILRLTVVSADVNIKSIKFTAVP